MKKIQFLLFTLLAISLLCVVGCKEKTCDHQYNEWNTKEPTCLEEGERTRFCKRCSEITTSVIPALGHDWSDWATTTPPTCDVDGESSRICANCKQTETEPISALGHDYDSQNICVNCFKPKPNDFLFEENETGYTFAGIDHFSGTDVIIPSIYKDKPVTAIKEYALSENESITSITIPNSVTSIGKYAFFNCANVTSITLPDRLNCNIEEYTFNGCQSLTEISIPNGVSKIRDYALAFCSSLTTVSLPNSLTDMGNYTFLRCASLTK
ncbi:MAG: leucine-rich repeat domain-containing protein, partial [Clostridia bacterium]|nr:leucine-rich repeat domain-containing protein [Clostridia bacterium]